MHDDRRQIERRAGLCPPSRLRLESRWLTVLACAVTCYRSNGESRFRADCNHRFDGWNAESWRRCSFCIVGNSEKAHWRLRTISRNQSASPPSLLDRSSQNVYGAAGVHPSNSLTVAQLGPPSRPVPGTRASSTPPVLRNFVGMPSRGIFNLRLQHESACPAYVPIST